MERDDFSSGTSSRSTKLIHGGVRYLQKAIMQLDREQVLDIYCAKLITRGFFSFKMVHRERNPSTRLPKYSKIAEALIL